MALPKMIKIDNTRSQSTELGRYVTAYVSYRRANSKGFREKRDNTPSEQKYSTTR